MTEPITMQRWMQAQEAERKCHTMTKEEGIAHYRNAYGWNFHYLGIEPDQKGKKIIEIGCADIPALYFCSNFSEGIVVEPMGSVTLLQLCKEKGLTRVDAAFEQMEFPEVDEVWMFNLLQHVIDPDLLVKKAKMVASAIRFFEPIDCGITDYHPHSISMEDLIGWYGEAVKLYDDKKPGFHDAPCAYGTWIK